jgi:isoamylase
MSKLLPTPISEKLGATWEPGKGVHFRLPAGVETLAAEIRIQGIKDSIPMYRIPAPRGNRDWYAFAPGAGPGTHYWGRVEGPWDPCLGLRHDWSMNVVDPAADALDGPLGWTPFRAPQAVVIDHRFDWKGDNPLASRYRLDQAVIYEAHVRGLTVYHPGLRKEVQGTYEGLKVAIPHLLDLGVTHLELMPVHETVGDPRDYWKYNPLCWRAPCRQYASAKTAQGAVDEFKSMVLAVSEAGIDVILDVVFNHTAEGNERGPSLTWKLLENRVYFGWSGTDHADGPFYMNRTGCGNTVNCAHPMVVRAIVEALESWVVNYHVRGFRFDLAGDVFSDRYAFNPNHPLLRAILEHPVLSKVLLIAEPWSAGSGECWANLPPPWLEWSGDAKRTFRQFWRSDPGQRGNFARCINGGRAAFSTAVHGPFRRVTYITCHDGFGMESLVSRNRKVNQESGEPDHDNCSKNCGVEGPTDDPAILAKRQAIKRAMWATMACTAGPIMLLYGDEMDRDTNGHNNPYNGGDELNGLSWKPDSPLLAFAQRVMKARKGLPAVRWHLWDDAKSPYGWYTPFGSKMEQQAWANAEMREGLLYLPGKDLAPVLEEEEDSDVLFLFNSFDGETVIRRPSAADLEGWYWHRLFDSGLEDEFTPGSWGRLEYRMKPSSVVLLVRRLIPQ